MWQGDFTFEALIESLLVVVDLKGGTPEAEATFRGQRVIVRLKEWQTILGVCWTWCMLYSVYATLHVMLYSGVNSWSWQGEVERDDFSLYSVMMVE